MKEKEFEKYEISFAGLKLGEHQFSFHIDNSFFELFDYREFHAVDVDVSLVLEKKANGLELGFTIDGVVNVDCDVSNVPYDQPVENTMKIVVKYGEEYNDEDEEILILPYGENKIAVQQFIYEAIILAVPYKKVHPKVLDGTMDSSILDKLEELSPENNNRKENETDPRWDKLKKLLNKK